ATAKNGPVVGKGSFMPPPVPHDEACASRMFFTAMNEPTFHCHGAEVEVEETGRIRVLRYVAAHDVGRVVDPLGVKGQVEGGVVQALGYALYEEMQTDAAGATRNADLVDYRLPTIADVPGEIEIVPIEGHLAPTGPYGAKGIGEAPVILPAATIGAALRDAT